MQFQHFPYLRFSRKPPKRKTPFDLPLGPHKIPVVPIVGLGPESIPKQNVDVNLDLRIDDPRRISSRGGSIYGVGAVAVRSYPIRVRSTSLSIRMRTVTRYATRTPLAGFGIESNCCRVQLASRLKQFVTLKSYRCQLPTSSLWENTPDPTRTRDATT